MINIFNETICDVLKIYILHETEIYDEQDLPRKSNKNKDQLSSRVKPTINNGAFLKKLQCLQNKLNHLIDTTKRKYYTRISMKLTDQMTSAERCWSILKRCLNDKEIPCIPRLFHDNKFITDFREKAELFNSSVF